MENINEPSDRVCTLHRRTDLCILCLVEWATQNEPALELVSVHICSDRGVVPAVAKRQVEHQMILVQQLRNPLKIAFHLIGH